MLAKLSLIPCVGLLMASTCALLPVGPWWLEIFTSFHPQFLICTLIAAGICFRRKKLALLFLAFSIAHGITIAPVMLGHQRVEPNPRDLRLMTCNVLTSNSEYQQLLDSIAAIEPDIVILLEMAQHWLEEIEVLEKQYPYQISKPRSDNFGLVVFSKLPMQGEVHLLGSQLPSVIVTVEADYPFTLIATHPLPPISARALAARNTQLEAVAALAKKSELPVLVAGDLNTTSWAPAMRRTLEDGNLRSAAKGWIPTWPANFFPLWVPLDHILHNEGIGISAFKRGENIGSDHFPVYADFRVLPASGKNPR